MQLLISFTYYIYKMSRSSGDESFDSALHRNYEIRTKTFKSVCLCDIDNYWRLIINYLLGSGVIELAEAIGESISSSSREPQIPDLVNEAPAPAVEFSSVARYVCLSACLFQVCLSVCLFVSPGMFVCLLVCVARYVCLSACLRYQQFFFDIVRKHRLFTTTWRRYC
jgi:hypothetical protein